jgi:hypothetical protein
MREIPTDLPDAGGSPTGWRRPEKGNRGRIGGMEWRRRGFSAGHGKISVLAVVTAVVSRWLISVENSFDLVGVRLLKKI